MFSSFPKPWRQSSGGQKEGYREKPPERFFFFFLRLRNSYSPLNIAIKTIKIKCKYKKFSLPLSLDLTQNKYLDSWLYIKQLTHWRQPGFFVKFSKEKQQQETVTFIVLQVKMCKKNEKWFLIPVVSSHIESCKSESKKMTSSTSCFKWAELKWQNDHVNVLN